MGYFPINYYLKKNTDSPNDTRKQPMRNCIRTQPSDLAALQLKQNLKLLILVKTNVSIRQNL